MPALEAPALRAAGAEHPGHCPTWTPWATAKGQHCETLLGADDLPPDPARAGGRCRRSRLSAQPRRWLPKGSGGQSPGPGLHARGQGQAEAVPGWLERISLPRELSWEAALRSSFTQLCEPAVGRVLFPEDPLQALL